MHPQLIRFGDSDTFFLSTYGVLVAIGFLAAWWLAARLARRRGLPPERISDIVVWSLLVGLVGSKLSLIFLGLPVYFREPALLLPTLRYAGVFYGGLLFGTAFVFLYCRRRGLPFGRVADVLAAPLALAHAFGRLGCFAAGCCFGVATGQPVPWYAVVFHDEAARTIGTPLGVPLHPVQLYEAGSNLLLFLVLLWLFLRRPPDGNVAAVYLLLYAGTRFLWEFLRADERGFLGPLSTSQWLALAVAAATTAILLVRAPRRRAPPPRSS